MPDRSRGGPRPPAPVQSGKVAPATSRTAPAVVPAASGWLPDCVFTGDKFESGLAFFADGLGRITRFSREPADLAAARRLSGQAALPGLVNAHSQSVHRLLRGRTEHRTKAEGDSLGTWRTALDRAVGRLTGQDLYDTARMTFLEMLQSGITCVGEFHTLHHQPGGQPWPEPNFLSQEVLRAARDVGVRLALFKVAAANAGANGLGPAALARLQSSTTEQFLQELAALQEYVTRNHPGDEAWVGVAPLDAGALPREGLKALADFAHAQRLRVQVPLPERAADHEAWVAAHGRTPVALLVELGLLDKRGVVVHADHLSDEDLRLLGAARASVCACPTTERNRGAGGAPVEKLLAAGVNLALGTGSAVQIDLLADARLIDYQLRQQRRRRDGVAPDPASPLFHAATAAGARALGAPSGALEVGRPADFFTVNLFDPSIAGTDPQTLLESIVFSLGPRAVREVWVGGRQRVANGRHAYHGPIVGNFVDLQRRLWSEKGAA